MKATEFDAQSAGFKKRHRDVQDLADKGWLVQPKYDGCFGMAVLQQDPDENRMLSRTGEDYSTSCQHLLNRLHSLLPTRRTPCVVLGEVWHPSWEFPKISGSMRRRHRCPELVFVAHDLLPVTLETNKPYGYRLSELRDYIPTACAFGVIVTVGLDRNNVRQQAADLKAQGGFDGVILKDPVAGYKIGNVRNGEIVKVKPTMSLDLYCGSTAIAPGEKTGRDVLRIAVSYKGQYSWVGSGIPHDLKQEDVIGKIVEVEFMGLTPDGYLREPRFKGIRFDKDKPDA